MQLRFFTIPIHGGDAAAEELNRLLAAGRIAAIERSLVQNGANSAWAVCVTVEAAGEAQPQAPKRGRVDYREVLNEQDFAVYARLRNVRKEIAERESVPAYAVLNNEQLAALVQKRVRTLEALKGVPGIGDSRAEKYGEAFLLLLREAFPSAPGKQKPPPVGNQGALL